MAAYPTPDQTDRIVVADADTMRRGARRSVIVGVVLLVLLAGFTSGGMTMVAAGELPGLPFAIGGAVAQASVIALNAAALRVRSSLEGGTVSRAAVHTARRLLTVSYATLLSATAGLAAYALFRLLSGDAATLLTAAIISVPLLLLLRGTGMARAGLGGMSNGAAAG